MPVFYARGFLLKLRLVLRENAKMGQLLITATNSLDPPLSSIHPSNIYLKFTMCQTTWLNISVSDNLACCDTKRW